MSLKRKEKELTSNKITCNFKRLTTDRSTDLSNGVLMDKDFEFRIDRTSSTNVARLHGGVMLYVDRICCWFSPCSRCFLPGNPVILPFKSQHFQIAIRPGHRTSWKSVRADVTFSFTITYLINRGFLSRNYGLIVAPRKFDEIFTREAKLRGQIC